MANEFPSMEVYLQAECGGWSDEGGNCDGCGADASRLTAGIPQPGPDERRTGNGYCEACVKGMWSYDQAEDRLVRGLLGGVVRAALETDVSAELIHSAVNRALDEQLEKWAFECGQHSPKRSEVA